MGRIFREFTRRRLPQVLGVYLAGAWGTLEFTAWAAERFQAGWDPTPLVLAVLVALLPVVLWGAWRLGAAESVPSLRTEAAPRSVAVLPFAVPGHDPDGEALGFGLADQILTDLSRVGDLQVAARTSSFAYRDPALDVREIGRRLGVRAVLEGSVQRMGDRIRVTTQLVNVADGYHLWSERWDRELEDVFRIQDEVAKNVARALHAILADGEGAVRTGSTPVPGAYEAYLRGRGYLWDQRRKNLEYARQMFGRALELDPKFALAHTGLAEATAILAMYYPSVAAAELDRAAASAERALALESELAEAHAALGAVRFLQGRLGEAEGSFLRAEELDPDLLDAWYLHGRVAFQQGRFLEAARLLRRAEAVEPDPSAAFFTAQALQAAGEEDSAREAFAHAAEVAGEHLLLNPDHARVATMAAVALCRLGREEEGLRWAERALEADPEDAGVRYNVACLYAVAGRTERALSCLREAVEVGFGNRAWVERDPDLDSLRGDPRLQELLDCMGGEADPEVSGGAGSGAAHSSMPRPRRPPAPRP